MTLTMDTKRTGRDPATWARVITLHGRIEQAVSKALQRRHGLGLSEYRALTQLAAAGNGCLRMQVLADAIGLNQSSVSRLVARLEDSGLSRRDLCDSDRRGVYTVITDTGRELQAAAEPTYAQILSDSLDESANDPGLAALVAALRTQAGQPVPALTSAGPA